MRDAIRTRHYSYRTEEAYVGWIRRYILFHHKRHPGEMGKTEIEQFLNYHAASSGFLAEIDRMQLEVREYLSVHPGDPSLRNAEPAAGAAGGR